MKFSVFSLITGIHPRWRVRGRLAALPWKRPHHAYFLSPV